MSWFKTLSDTYDNIVKQGDKKLLPIAHSTQNAHIEITLNTDSEIIYAELVDHESAPTIIPVTEASASRSSGVAPHALCDKLQYIAGDFDHFTDKKGEKHFQAYMNQLKSWKDSDYANNKLNIIYNYLSKRKLITDLVDYKILSLDENNKLTEKFESSEKKLSAGNQIDSFVRFRVNESNNTPDAVWEDDNLINSYVNYYLSKEGINKLCYISGEEKRITNNHPSKILSSGDKAKLISSNDTTFVTYKGRFHQADEAITVSYETSQKAHNALKWLIENQGKRVGEKVFVLWGIDAVPKYMEDTVDFTFNSLENQNTEDLTKRDLAEEFNKAILSYRAKIEPNTKLSLIGLQAPTTGRLSVIFYREYNGKVGNELIDNIKKWHEEASWRHSYKFIQKKQFIFYGAPSLYEIARCAYGTEQNELIKVDDKILGNAIERLIPSVIDGRKIPRDIVLKLLERSKHPQNYSSIHNWYKILTITCAVYRKYLLDYEKEEYTMELKDTANLAYNCGRMLAIADAIEAWSLRANLSEGSSEGIRSTNAIRYFTRFSMSPASTWMIIREKLMPHQQRLGARGGRLYELLGEISKKIDPDEFQKAKNLDGCLVLGFDAQRQDLFNNKKEKKEIEYLEEE